MHREQGAVNALFGNDKLPWLLLATVSLFVISIVFATVPYRRKKITGSQAFFWILIVPSAVLLLLSQVPFSFPITLNGIPTQP